ncbi:phage tail tape measure protein [Streptomyces sp. TP-A0875]|uniref:phage tail tape measure protein n=1 Tax=Streptomyces sp. TP-A0875 TaxID=552354 RepID=UPI0006B40169|nr:phage tail tape measure protein [Streptomyces sp. TP-A0875]
MALSVGELFATLRLDDSRFRTSLRSARDSLQSAGQTVARLGPQMTQTGDTIAGVGQTISTRLSLPIAGVAATALKMGGDFQASMNGVRAVTGATGQDFDDLRAMAKQMGSETQFSATDAAGAMEFLGMTGWKAKDIMAGLPDVLNLAAAGNTELATTADIASNIMGAFGIEASDMARVSDVLAQTMRSANVDLEMLGESMKYTAPLAHAAGWSLEETAGAVGFLGNVGIQGSAAGTGLNSMLATLADTSSTGGKKLREFGVAAQDSNGQVRPLTEILKDLADKGADVADVVGIFGLEAGPKLQALLGQGSEGLKEMIKDLESSEGVAKEMADIRMEGFNGSVMGLKSAFEGLMIAVADSGLLDWATQFTDKLTGMVSRMTSASPATLRIATLIGLLVAAVGPGVFIVGKLVSVFGSSISTITQVARAVRGLNLAFLASPVGLVIAAIALLAVGLVTAYQKSERFREIVDKAFRALREAFDHVMVALQPLIDAVKLTFAEFIDAAGQIWSSIQPHLMKLRELFDRVMSGISDAVSGVVDFVSAIWSRWGENILGMAMGVWMMIRSQIEGTLGIIRGVIKTVTGLITGDWSGAWAGVRQILSSAWDMIGGILDGALTYFRNLWAIGLDFIWSITKSVWGSVLDFVKSIPGRIVGFFANWSLTSTITNHWTRVKTGTINKAKELLSWVRGLPGLITSALGSLGSLLYDKGRDLIRGLFAGVRAMGGWLRSQLISFAKSAIPQPIAKALGIASPSKVMADAVGRWIPAGIVDGIEAGRGALTRTMQSLVQPPPVPALSPALAGGFGGYASAVAGGGSGGPTVAIEHWHAAENGSPDDNARALAWLAKGRG